MTKGEYLVGVEFNPVKNPDVTNMKCMVAACIDFIREAGADPRTKALAVTAFEEAAMWAVKSITKDLSGDPDIGEWGGK